MADARPANEAFADYWIYTKHPEGQEEYAQVKQVQGFHPTDKEDLGPSGKKYVLWTSKWSRRKGKIEGYRVHILRMEGKSTCASEVMCMSLICVCEVYCF